VLLFPLFKVILTKKSAGLRFGRFFAQTYLVTLLAIPALRAGLPDGIFSDQKSQSG
jgi:hypothetical protein